MAKGSRGPFLVGLTLGAAAGLWAYGRWLIGRAETLDPEQTREPKETLYIDDIALHYIDKGQGPPLILIHGLGGSLANFDRILPILVERLRVVALDLLGYGLSDRPPRGDYSQTRQAKLIGALMDRLGIGQASLLGHSLGGAIALRFASLFPQRVDRLILVCSPPPLALKAPFLNSPLLRPLMETVVALVLHSRRLREPILRQGFWQPQALSPEVMEGYFFPGRLRGTTPARAKMVADIGRDGPIDLAEVRQPTLLLWAEGDRWLPPRLGHQLAARLPHARLEMIPRARHLLLEERPEEAAGAILAFLLEEVEAPTAAPPPAA